MSKKTQAIKLKKSQNLKIIGLFVFVFLASVLLVYIFKSKTVQGLMYDRNIRHDISVIAPKGTIDTELADSDSERERGLSFRNEMQISEGMLFVFDKSAKYAFWMKDMNFPIDILWLDEEGRVVYMEENVAVSTYPGYFINEAKAKYVFEINAGMANKLGIYLGTKLVISTSTNR